jgi:SnoaL-like polyketide cyclase
MVSDWLDGYIDAWLPHPYAGGPDGAEALERLLDFMSENVRYEDVPSSSVFEGHDGIAAMCAGAFQMSSDLTFEIVTRQTNGQLYAFETLGTGTNTGAIGPIPGTGRPIELRGISIGSISPDGRVESHRDYWDMAGLLVQPGVLADPST